MNDVLLWDLAETARQLGGVSTRTVRRLLERGDIESRRVGRRLLVTAASVCAYEREPEGRVRWITRAEAARLIETAAEAKQAPYLAPLIQVALNTGMRREEMLGLEWNRVDLQHNPIYLEAHHTKGMKRRTVALNSAAREAILTQARYRATYCPDALWVFCRPDGSRIRTAQEGFANACRRAGIEDFRFHDLRHNSVSRIIPTPSLASSTDGGFRARWRISLGIIRGSSGRPAAHHRACSGAVVHSTALSWQGLLL